jgi:hypothetical protein
MKKARKRKSRRAPSKASLEEMPEMVFVNPRSNRFASRLREEGIVVQIGRGRPRKLLEVGETSPRSLRFPDEIWRAIEKKAKQEKLSVHAALRKAVLEWVKKVA